jgi:hypothetical protein
MLPVWRCTLFWIILARIFRKVESGLPPEKCDSMRKIKQLPFPWKQKLLWSVG